MSRHGAPRYLRADNGPEFNATALLRWLQTAKIDTAFIDPGKPWQNGTNESFNGKFRNGIVKLRLTTVSDAQHGVFTTDSSAVSWGSID